MNTLTPTEYRRQIIPRLLIGVVLFFNLQCALLFLIQPQNFVSSFELSGVPGQAAVQGYGILFIMWNIPYLIALLDPQKYRIALICAVLMQFTGLTGETLLFINLPQGYNFLRQTVERFIIFDAGGLIALAAALWQSSFHRR